MTLKRTFSMFSALTQKEKERLDFVIKNKKRKTIKYLHKFIKSNKTNKLKESKEEIYKAIYNKQYSKKKDYLLRNEIRLYNKEIKEILAISGVLKDSTMFNMAFSNELASRNLLDLQTVELKRIINSHKHLKRYGKLANTLEQLISKKLESIKYNTDFIYGLKELLLEEYEARVKQFNDVLSENVLRTAFVERVLHQLTQKPNYTPVNTNIDLSKKNCNTEYSTFNYLRAQSYLQHGKEKVATLKNLLKGIKKTGHPKINAEKETISIISSMATELLITGNYEEAKTYFEQCIKYKNQLPELRFILLLHNYLSTLTKINDYKKAVNLLDQFSEKFEHTSIKERITPLAIGIYIMNNNIDKAEALMPQKIKDGDLDSYHYYRALQIMLHYENSLIELAHNESKNLKKHLYLYQEETNYCDIDVCNLLIQFVNIQFTKTTLEKKGFLEELKKDLDLFRKKHDAFSADNLIIKWLELKLS